MVLISRTSRLHCGCCAVDVDITARPSLLPCVCWRSMSWWNTPSWAELPALVSGAATWRLNNGRQWRLLPGCVYVHVLPGPVAAAGECLTAHSICTMAIYRMRAPVQRVGQLQQCVPMIACVTIS